jgi:NhaA family Na+:H+ antiporter
VGRGRVAARAACVTMADTDVGASLNTVKDDHIRVQGDASRMQGADASRVTMLVYGDYECPHTRALELAVARLRARAGDSFRYVFRFFPLREIHPHAQMAAEAAESAFALGGPDAFWTMHDSLFADQQNLDPFSLERRCVAIGLDAVAFSTALRTRRFAERIERDIRTAALNGVAGTPSVFMNGRRYTGPRDVTALRQVIAEISAR